jgi:hypothetical protein
MANHMGLAAIAGSPLGLLGPFKFSLLTSGKSKMNPPPPVSIRGVDWSRGINDL